MEFDQKINNFIEKKKIDCLHFNLDCFTGYKVAQKDLIVFIHFLQSNKDLRFTILTDLFAADFPERQKRFEIVYNLLSLKLNKRILVKIEVDEEESLPSLTCIYPAACWYEREVFDMFGVIFNDTHDLRRILTDYGFKGHPLRKDFPVTGHVQVKYDETLEKVIYEPVELEQEFRNFDFVSPWQGPGEYVLPGDEKAATRHPEGAKQP